MRAGLQIDVNSRTARFFSGLLDAKDFGMFHPIVCIAAGPDDGVVRIDEYRPDARVGRSQANSLACQIEGLTKEAFVGLV